MYKRQVVNYAGLVRGKTQRIIKLEDAGEPQDTMIADINAYIDGLQNGSSELDLVRLDDRDFQDKSTLISEMTVDEARTFVDGGQLGGGMLPKLQNCVDAIENGVSRVHILDGRIPHCLLLEIFTNQGIGTVMFANGAERYFHAIQ